MVFGVVVVVGMSDRDHAGIVADGIAVLADTHH